MIDGILESSGVKEVDVDAVRRNKDIDSSLYFVALPMRFGFVRKNLPLVPRYYNLRQILDGQLNGELILLASG